MNSLKLSQHILLIVYIGNGLIFQIQDPHSTAFYKHSFSPHSLSPYLTELKLYELQSKLSQTYRD